MSVTSSEDAWLKLRGLLRSIYAELGGGEGYLQSERERFYGDNSPMPQENGPESEPLL